MNGYFSKGDTQMANKYMKRCSTSLIIREMQIKTTIRYHLIPVRMSIINKSANNKFWQRCGERIILWLCWWEYILVQPLWKVEWRYLKKLTMELPSDPLIPLLGIYPKKPKTLIQKNISIPMFIAALFTVIKIWKQPKRPSVDEWIKQFWGIFTMEYYSAVKKEKILPFMAAWMNLENIVLSEISQSEKAKYHVISLICGI